MKRYTHPAIILLAALAFAGCSKVEEFNSNPDSALMIESVRGISSYKLMSKAVITGESLPDDESTKGIGLFVTASDGGAYDGKDSGYTNVKYSFNGTKWSAASPIYLSHSTGKLYGYFPYSETATDLTKIPVASSLNGTDYLYATPKDVSYSNKSVDLQMSHALARLHLTIKMGDTYLSGGNLTRIAIQSKAIDSYGTMDIKTGAVAGIKDESTTGSVVFDGDGVTGIVSKTGIEKDILLVPADNSEGKKDLTLILTIDGVEAKVIFTGDKGLDIRSGIQNNVTLTIEDTGIKVTGIGVDEWGEVDSQEVQVDGHRVTVKFSSNTEDDGIAKDVLTAINVDGSNVIIEAFSKSQERRLACYLGGVASCRTATKEIFSLHVFGEHIRLISHIFTISDISSDITATIGYPRPESISLSSSNSTTYAGCSIKLSATIKPDDALNKNITWSSSDNSIATIDGNGIITGKAAGTVDITATTEVGGLTATCKVNILKAYEPIILPGKFSVASGKKVRFSQGNLRYTPSTGLWWFFDNQYEWRHNQDQLSLFTWGFGDWSTDWATRSYEDENFTDWGTKIGDGKTWHTLTKDEWVYLIKARTDAANKVGYATVCGMSGLLLLPDEFEDPKTNGNKNCEEGKFVPQSSTGWEQNIYPSGDSWNKMQSAGAVFLPAAGRREGNECLADYTQGFYWSSTPYSSLIMDPYYLNFYDSDVDPDNSLIDWAKAFAVRLVIDVK